MSAAEPFDVPGTDGRLWCERDDAGRLLRLWSGDAVYVADAGAGERVWGDGLATVREVALPNGLLRHVSAHGDSWVEEYLDDEAGRPVRVDGVEVLRDERHRVTACLDGRTEWRYGYAGDRLAVVATPAGMRSLAHGVDGRPVSWRDASGARTIRYDESGARDGVPPLPRGWHRDALGRLWSIVRDDGSVAATFLWDGFACLGRLAGPPGAPLDAWFSLDRTRTPVRVVTRDGVLRIPRDAFGESLLGHAGVPGLYGGAVLDGFVHLRSRVLDPRCGAFDRRDPWYGGQADPRRGDDYSGPLVVETPPCGPYAVSRYDAVGRVDPTGDISLAYALSDLTWSLQNNAVGVFGLDLTIGWWTSFVVGIGQLIAKVFGGGKSENWIARYFDFEALHNERTGAWGLRRGYLNLEQSAFTYQHLVVSSHEFFDDPKAINVIDPNGPFEPLLYGTILHVAPEKKTPFLLSGNRSPALEGWTRAGGEAKPVAPGSPACRFPSGGLHLEKNHKELLQPLTCTVTELVPSGVPATALVSQSTVAIALPSGVTLKAGDRVLLSDGAGVLEIKTVLDQSGSRVRFQEPGTALAKTGVRLRGLAAAGGDTRPPAAAPAPAGRYSTAGTAVKYTAGDALRLSQGGALVGAVTLEALEARISIDAKVPAALVLPLEVRSSVAGVRVNGTIAGDVLTTPAPPAVGTPLGIFGPAGAIGAMVTQSVSATECRLDRTAAELAAVGTPLQWSRLPEGTVIGNAAAADAAATLTFAPLVAGSSPSADFVILRDASASKTRVVRAVSALDYEALVFSATPGNPATAYEIERFTITPVDHDKLAHETDNRLAVPPGTNLTGTALQIVDLAGDTLTAGTVSNAATIAGGVATLTAAAFDCSPSELVIISSGAKLEPNVVSRIRAKVKLVTALTFAAGATLDAVPLQADGPRYDATVDAADPLKLVVAPKSGPTVLQMPRFSAGNLVVIAGVPYRVATAAGTTLQLADGPGLALAAAVTVQRLVPTTAVIHDTWRIGLRGAPDGVVVAGNVVTDKVQLDVWRDNHFPVGALIGLIEGAITHPAVVDSVAYDLHFLTPPAATGAVNVTMPGGPISYASSFTQKGADLTVENVEPPLPAAPNLLIVVPYGPGTVKVEKATMSSGSLLVPVEPDPKKYDIDRYKSLVYHELTHTSQSLELGPLYLGMVPVFLLEGVLALLTDVDLEVPTFSPYVPATIQQSGALLLIAIDGEGYETGQTVQVSDANGALVTLELGAPNGTRFSLGTQLSLTPGPAHVRRLEEDGSKAVTTFKILRLLTPGALTNLGAGLTWGPAIALVREIISRITDGDVFTYFDATVPDPARPARVVVAPHADGKKHDIAPFSRVTVRTGSSESRTNATAVDGDAVELEDIPRTEGPERKLQIAEVSGGDPVANYDTAALQFFGVGWMRHFIDPYAFLDFKTDPKPGSFGAGLSRLARYAFSSHSWGIPGYVFAFLARLVFNRKFWVSALEQRASEESGTVYTPEAKLYGDVKAAKAGVFKPYTTSVGDIGHYWFWPYWFFGRDQPLLPTAEFDRPGANRRNDLLVVPTVGPEGAAGPLNRSVASTDPAPGAFLPDVFYGKAAATLLAPPGLDVPDGFAPNDRGLIPVSARNELCIGCYVSFTAPGTHRVTVSDSIGSAGNARDAHNAETQTIFFTIDVQDVDVTVGERPVPRATPLPVIELVPFQTAKVIVSRPGAYALLVTRPGEFVTVDNNAQPPVLTGVKLGSDTVEVSRRYRSTGAGQNAYADPVLATHGVHLGGDVDVPVRTFEVKVVDTLLMRDSAGPGSTGIVNRKPGEVGFVVVPGSIVRPLETKTAGYKPVITAAGANTYRIEFPAAEPPEAVLLVNFEVQVGTVAKPVTLKVTATVQPHFTLAAAAFNVTRGDPAGLVLTATVDIGTATLRPPDPAVTVTASGKTVTVKATNAAAPGPRTVLVSDKDAPTHFAIRTVTIV